MSQITAVEISTVGDLRRALADAADTQVLLAQVVAADETAWYLSCTAHPGKAGSFAVLTLRHPDLLTLPPIGRP